jgi:hydroxymethylbilane synthase
MGTIRVGTRGSNLALWQATFVRETLERHHPGIRFEQVIIKTGGDLDQKSSLSQIGGQGIFTKEIEKALLNNTIDIAVHSLKDLPSKMPEGLILVAVQERGYVEDVLITANGTTLDQLPQNAKVATGSIRRKSQLLSIRPDLIISDLRGNIDTRLRKLKESDIDAIIMAKAAILRLELDQVLYYEFNTGEMIPAVGQGAIGIQVRKEDRVVQDIVKALNHQDTFHAVTAERALLATLDSGCQFPVGAFARVSGNSLDISGFVGSEDGKNILHEDMKSEVQEARNAGRILAEKLLDRGAKSLLDEFSNK